MPVPVNDLCANATVLPAGLPYSLSGFDTTLATQSADDPFNADAGEIPFNTVWFKWTATTAMVVVVDTFTSDYDTVLGIYTGHCGGPWVTIAENDENFTEPGGLQSGGGHTSRIAFVAIPGTTYYIVVGSFAGGGGSLSLHLTEQAVIPPSPLTIIPSLPYTDTQNVDSGAGAQTVYYQYTATAADDVLSIFAFGDLTTYIAQLTIYIQSTGFILLNLSGITKAIQIPVTAGVTYYIRVGSVNGAVSPAILNFRVDRSPRGSLPAGTIAISDDTPGFPLAFLDGASGSPIRFHVPFPAGEGGDILPTGESMWVNSQTNEVTAFDAAFVEQGSILTTPTDRLVSIRTNRTTKFYIGSPGDQVYIADAAGVALGVEAVVDTHLSGAAPSLDETILYYTSSLAAAAPVKRWSLTTHAPLSDLVAGVAGAKITRPLLVLLDGTILVPYFTAAGPITEVRRYDATGTLLNTYSFPLNTNADFQIASSLDDPISFMAWERRAGGFSGFVQVQVSDGARLVEFTAIQYNGGVYAGSITATPVAFFGHSESCPFMLLRTPPPPPVGIAACPTGLGLQPAPTLPACATAVAIHSAYTVPGP